MDKVEEGAPTEEAGSVYLPAPDGWKKKKDETSVRNDILFISPTGEEIRNKRQLDQYMKSHPGGPHPSEFDWSTGDASRRSARISERAKTTVIPEAEDMRPKKRGRRSSLKKGDVHKNETWGEGEGGPPEQGSTPQEEEAAAAAEEEVKKSAAVEMKEEKSEDRVDRAPNEEVTALKEEPMQPQDSVDSKTINGGEKETEGTCVPGKDTKLEDASRPLPVVAGEGENKSDIGIKAEEQKKAKVLMENGSHDQSKNRDDGQQQKKTEAMQC